MYGLIHVDSVERHLTDLKLMQTDILIDWSLEQRFSCCYMYNILEFFFIFSPVKICQKLVNYWNKLFVICTFFHSGVHGSWLITNPSLAFTAYYLSCPVCNYKIFWQCWYWPFIAGANVNATTATGDTPLSFACENGHNDVADVLLSAGAELVRRFCIVTVLFFCVYFIALYMGLNLI